MFHFDVFGTGCACLVDMTEEERAFDAAEDAFYAALRVEGIAKAEFHRGGPAENP